MVHDDAHLLTLHVPDFEAALRKAAAPRLRDRPVAVASAFKSMGRILAACPAARSLGVREDMPYPVARALAPDAAFLLPDRGLAERAVAALLKQASAFSPLVEPAGGGRILIDTRGTERLWGGGVDLAARLRRETLDSLRLPAVAGLASRRPWSLFAGRAAAAEGVCVVGPGVENEFLDRVPVDWIDGLTPRIRARLAEMNIRAVGGLGPFGRDELVRQFGREAGGTLWNAVHPGPWDVLACPRGGTAAAVSAEAVSLEAALDVASAEPEKLRLVALDLGARAARTLRERGLGAARLRLALLYADGMISTRQTRTGGYVDDAGTLGGLAAALLELAFRRRVRAARLRLSAEKLSAPMRQGSLFPESDAPASPPLAVRRRAGRLEDAVDAIHHRYGEDALASASLLAHRGASNPELS